MCQHVVTSVPWHVPASPSTSPTTYGCSDPLYIFWVLQNFTPFFSPLLLQMKVGANENQGCLEAKGALSSSGLGGGRRVIAMAISGWKRQGDARRGQRW